MSRQTTLNFDNHTGEPRFATEDSTSPAPEPKSSRAKRREPIRQAFDHGRREEGYVSGGEDVSDEDEDEIRLENVQTRQHGQDPVEDTQEDDDSDEEEESSGQGEQDSEEDSEEMMDLEAEEDEGSYHSGDSLEEEDQRTKSKKRTKGKEKGKEPESESEIEFVTPEKKRSKGKKRRIVESSEDDAVILQVPVASTSKTTLDQNLNSRRKKSARQNNDVDDAETDSGSSPPKLPSSTLHQSSLSKGKKRVVESSSSSGSDSDPLPEPEILRNHRSQKGKSKRSRSESSGSPTKPTKKKKKIVVKRKLKKLTQGTKDRRSADEEEGSQAGESSGHDFVVPDDQVESDPWSESERDRLLGPDEARRRRREEEQIRAADKERLRQKRLARERKREEEEKARSDAAQGGDDESEEEEPVKSQRRRGKAKASPLTSKKKSRRDIPEDASSEEDLEILDEETVLEQRLRGTKSTVSSKFDQIRAARANRGSSSQQPIVIDSSGSNSPAPEIRAPRPTWAGQSGSEEDEEGDESDGEDDSGEGSPSRLEDVDSDNFIVSDEEGDIGNEEAQEELEKLRENMRAKAQGLKYFLKTYLNYLVHLVVCPEARWLANSDFQDAKDKVEGYLNGVLSSSLDSSGWVPKFRHTINTRPVLEVAHVSDTPPCDACAQGKTRRATFLGTFSGEKYDEKTLQPLNPEDDESEPSSSSSSSSSEAEDESETGQDVFGRIMSGSNKQNRKRRSKDKVYEFNLGKHCAGRAEIYHQFKHWPYLTKKRIARLALPLRDVSIKEARREPGMSNENWKKAIKKERRARERDAGKVAAELDARRVISDLATTLDVELERSIKAFST